MTRSEILKAAEQAITVDRAATHGEAERNFPAIVAMWNALDDEIGCADVAAMMILLKLARMNGNPSYGDNWVDIAGYAACDDSIPF